ncbi:Kiwa anti-phage protein KwaB-like domain-containing protein [Wenyingzhuangia sp. IMCC45574]
MTIKQTFKSLKKLDLSNSSISLAVVKEYKSKRESKYNISYVPIDEKLETRLANIIKNKIEKSNSIEEYSFDCPEPEEDQIRSINSEGTDFEKILDKLIDLNPEEDIIENVDELVKSKSYLIILRIDSEIKLVGFKKLPENWKMKKSKGFIPLLYKENRFEDLEEENVFSISNSLDFIYYSENLFILNKKGFEAGLNFREGMISKANEFYEEAQSLNLFVNIDKLEEKVGNNQRYLRKISTIKKLGHYKDQLFLNRFKTINDIKQWGVEFTDDQIIIEDNNIETILTILQNKRLHSDLTEEDFDVESVKSLEHYKK